MCKASTLPIRVMVRYNSNTFKERIVIAIVNKNITVKTLLS